VPKYTRFGANIIDPPCSAGERKTLRNAVEDIVAGEADITGNRVFGSGTELLPTGRALPLPPDYGSENLFISRYLLNTIMEPGDCRKADCHHNTLAIKFGYSHHLVNAKHRISGNADFSCRNSLQIECKNQHRHSLCTNWSS